MEMKVLNCTGPAHFSSDVVLVYSFKTEKITYFGLPLIRETNSPRPRLDNA